MNQTLIQTAVLITAATALLAQSDIRRATIKGQSGDRGKCTIEVVVDVAAEVSIYGDTGDLRTLGGQPSQWRRMECTGPLTYDPSDFKFSGVDGRGNQTLVADPRSNRGVAVIRIEDPKGGSEGYTFDIEWRGGTVRPGSGAYPVTGGMRQQLSAQVVDACQQAVRDRAVRDFGYRDLNFGSLTLDNNPGRRDWVMGTADPRGFRRDPLQFSCQVDFRSGQVRTVELTRAGQGGRLGNTADRQGAVRTCQDAASSRAGSQGYSEMRVRWADLDNRPGRLDRVEGTLSARGRDGSEYFLDFTCTVDQYRGNVRNVDLRQR